MKRSDRIRSLVALAEQEERELSRALGAARRKLGEDRDRLDELGRYRREYQQAPPDPSGSSSLHWQEHHEFLRRLDEAIAAQRFAVREAEERRDAQHQSWVLKRQRVESLKRVLERYELGEREAEERRQQRELDAIASRRRPFAGDP